MSAEPNGNVRIQTWAAVAGVFLVFMGMLGGLVYFAYANVTEQVHAEHALNQAAHDRSIKDRDQLRDMLMGLWKDEQQRNNRIEREMGAANAIDELFKQGKLKLE